MKAYTLQVIFLKKLWLLIIPLIICSLILQSSVNYKNEIVATTVDGGKGSLPTIIIDAGHGGFDGGTQASDGTVEKDINLRIALYLNDFLQTFGYETVLTRDSDESLEDENLKTIREKKKSDIYNRFDLMESTENAIFVSIHQNHYPVEKYHGTQVFYSPEQAEDSSKLAQSIQEAVVELLQNDNDRQIKKCGTSVYLIYNAVKPAVLVECGFMSNTEEAELLKTQDYQKKIAFCIAVGIQNYTL